MGSLAITLNVTNLLSSFTALLLYGILKATLHPDAPQFSVNCNEIIILT
jgi:hypothetical protein